MSVPSRPTTSDELRAAFVQFFQSKGHRLLPSSSLVPHNDPTVLLTTAGMQQMIPYMLGREQPPAPRLVSVQKCFRTTDIDQVGNPRSLTFFEMLGNFSIGDYFKEGAIAFAWEFVRAWLQFPEERVQITVHPTDDEALRIWQEIGVPRERITFLEENWWGPPGAEGPCGPDSELYYDRGPEYGCGRPSCAPGCDCDRYLEFWNLVFMQYFQDREGRRAPLAQKNIDTGMGLERTTMLLQGTPSVYETDLFLPIMNRIAALVGTAYGRDPRTDFGLRIIADHGRGMTLLVSDGVVPEPVGRGYILRRIIRRAVRYGRLIGLEGPFLGQVADAVIERMRAHYPELERNRALIHDVIGQEERTFLARLEAGLARLDRVIAEARARGERVVPGAAVFDLYQTYGFPPELSAEVLAEQGLSYDRAGYEAAERRHAEVSRAGGPVAAHVLAPSTRDLPRTEFLGYETVRTSAQVLAVLAEAPSDRPGQAGETVLVGELVEGQRGRIILDRTCCYPEGGGQVGDTGRLVSGEGVFRVEDTRDDEAGHVLHIGLVEAGRVRLGQEVVVEVDAARRAKVTHHHSVTHLLHRALKDVFGESTMQRGSLVAPEVARFDFNLARPPAPDELQEVQKIVNERLLEDLAVRWRITTYDEAIRSGAIAIFGEKYGHDVRVVEIGEYSKELCGGTHVHHTGQIGSAYIRSSTGIGAGLRRVEVVAGWAALEYANRQAQRLQEIAQRLGAPAEEVERRVVQLLDELERLRKEWERMARLMAAREAESLAERAVTVDGLRVVAARVEGFDEPRLREMADVIRAKIREGVVVLGAVADGRPLFIAAATKGAVSAGAAAGAIVGRVAELAGGKGGGRPDLARGGGKDPALLGEALARVPAIVQELVRPGGRGA